MNLKLFGIKVKITYFFAALVFILLISDTAGTAPLALISALCHEAGHIIAMKREGCEVREIVLSPIGASIVSRAWAASYRSERKVCLCGPLANLLLGAFSFFLWLILNNQKLLLFCFINLFMGFFNLLPVASFDGSGILKSFLSEKYSAEKAQAISKIISVCLLCLLCAFGVFFLCLPYKNPTLLITAVYMLILEFSKLKILKNCIK